MKKTELQTWSDKRLKLELKEVHSVLRANVSRYMLTLELWIYEEMDRRQRLKIKIGTE